MIELAGTWLVPGRFEGSVLRLDEPLSFWGGVDPGSGEIIDRAHPQNGERFGGRVVVMPGSRGSSGTPGVLGEALRLGTGPSALVITKPDINLVAGSLAATTLYDARCPVLLVADEWFERLETGDLVTAETTVESV